MVNKGRVNRDPRAAAARLLKKKKQLDAAKAEKAKQQGLWSTLTNSLFGSSATAEDKGTAAHVDSDNAAIAASTVSDVGEQSGGDELALEAGAAGDGQSLVEEDNRIHVFSLATGHMYERLVSVVRSVGFSTDEMTLCRVCVVSHVPSFFLAGGCSCAS